MIRRTLEEVRSELMMITAETERILATAMADHRNADDLARHIAEIRSLVQQAAECVAVLRCCRRESEGLYDMAVDYLALEGRVKEMRNDLLRLASRPNRVND